MEIGNESCTFGMAKALFDAQERISEAMGFHPDTPRDKIKLWCHSLASGIVGYIQANAQAVVDNTTGALQTYAGPVGPAPTTPNVLFPTGVDPSDPSVVAVLRVR
jgi:hypothetical protein